MKYCPSCKLQVVNDTALCPLCGTSLTDGENTPCKNTYPVIAESFYKYNFLFRLFLFLSIVAATVCLMVDFFTAQGGHLSWSIIVLAGIAYVWVTTAFSFRGTGNFATKYAVQVLSVSLVLYIIDYYSGYGRWSVNYVIPFFLMLATFAITFLIIFKRVDRHEFLFCQLVIGAFGLVPLLFFPLRLIQVAWPAVASAAYSLLTLAGTVIFADRYVRHELNKRFHV